MLSTSAIRWLVASAAFERDVSLAAAIANGTRPRGLAVERVPQDVQMGYWLSSHPTLRYISIPRKTTWADAFVEVTDLQRLLIAHRVPWDQIGWLTSRTQRLWAVSPARLQFRCGGPPCRRASARMRGGRSRVRSTLYWVPHHPVCRPSDATIATAGRNSRRAVLEPAASAISPGTTSRRCPLTAWLQHEGLGRATVREGPRKGPFESLPLR